MKKINKAIVGVSLAPSAVKKLDEVVKKLNLRSRSEMLEFLISRYLPDPENQEALEELAVEIAKWKILQAKEKRENSSLIIYF